MEPILILAPNAGALETLRRPLKNGRTLLLSATSADLALTLARKRAPKVAVIDLTSEPRASLALADTLTRDSSLPFIAVLLIGPVPASEGVEYEEMLRQPGVVAISRRLSHDELAGQVRNLIGLVSRIRESREAGLPDPASRGLKHLIGLSPAMIRVYELLSNAAASDCAVLILGETGSGKELAARTLHELSARRQGPYVAINPAAFNEGTVESELFGHEHGAFTGAIKRRLGCLERANGGTLYLDEVDSVPIPVQIKLLRALQERRFERVGGEESIPVDFRLAASATGLAQLRSAIERNTFRTDFFYRLHGVVIPLPPLRERVDDIGLLAEHFLERLALKYGRALRLGPHALEPMTRYSWPGNVRELERAVESAVALSSSDVIDSIPVLGDSGLDGLLSAATLTGGRMPTDGGATLSESLSYSTFLNQQRAREAEFFRELLRRCGDRQEAVRLSGLSRATFYRRLRELGLAERNANARSGNSLRDD